MDHSHSDSQLHSRRSSSITSTRRYYIYAGATFPCNGDDSPIDRNNYISFPGKAGSSCLKKGDSGHVPSPSLSPSPLPSPSSLKSTYLQDRGWVRGAHHSLMSNLQILDELLDSYSGDVDIAELVGSSIKRTTSSSSSGDYQGTNIQMRQENKAISNMTMHTKMEATFSLPLYYMYVWTDYQTRNAH